MPKRATEHRVAVVQHAPVTLHRKETLERGVDLIEEAAAKGARLISFPETWVPGYPEWLWRLRPGGDYELTGEIHRRLIENSVDLKAGDLKPIQAAAKRMKVTVSIGVHERDGEFSRGTLYNTVVLVGADGSILNHHRKLVPTNPERMVWGMGDDTYIAPTWDEGPSWIATMQHISTEGRCWVLGSGCAMRGKDIPKDFPQRAKIFPDLESWYNPGDSVIVAPRGKIVAGPMHEAHGILYADCDPGVAAASKRTLDVAGHYGRPDLFRLEVKREALT